jgi:CheY-like chemotaxis protein
MEPKSAASTILVIEDSVYLRLLLAEVFDAEGYRVHTAGHGAEALRILQDTAVDVILTDLRMPVMNGLKFATVVRADTRHAHIPIVLLSATPLKDSQAGRHLFSAFLWKPSPLEEIIQAVRKAQADADTMAFEKSA